MKWSAEDYSLHGLCVCVYRVSRVECGHVWNVETSISWPVGIRKRHNSIYGQLCARSSPYSASYTNGIHAQCTYIYECYSISTYHWWRVHKYWPAELLSTNTYNFRYRSARPDEFSICENINVQYKHTHTLATLLLRMVTLFAQHKYYLYVEAAGCKRMSVQNVWRT